MKSFVDYQGALDGKYNRRLSMHPVGAFIAERGGSYQTNQFADPALSFTGAHLKNFLEIIKSGRRQGFLGIDIVVANELDVRINEHHLSMLQRINVSSDRPCKNTESWPNHWLMKVEYPALIYEENVLRRVTRYTSLHKKYMTPPDIKNLQAGIAFPEKMTIAQKHLLLRALELDEEPLICTDDVFG